MVPEWLISELRCCAEIDLSAEWGQEVTESRCGAACTDVDGWHGAEEMHVVITIEGQTCFRGERKRYIWGHFFLCRSTNLWNNWNMMWDVVEEVLYILLHKLEPDRYYLYPCWPINKISCLHYIIMCPVATFEGSSSSVFICLCWSPADILVTLSFTSLYRCLHPPKHGVLVAGCRLFALAVCCLNLLWLNSHMAIQYSSATLPTSCYWL